MADLPDYNEQCTRCDSNVIKVHPLAWMVVDLISPELQSATAVLSGSRYLLCGLCMIELGEFLVPGLKDDPVWISEKDQAQALMNGSGRDV